ncbi:MAG: non-heme ferritin [Deltaproteobacteria bacterium]|nr:non-heme ferritin [Deltaproteobacteria bacterium]
MLSTTLIDKLNAQITLEFYSSNLYLQMAAWCDTRGFPGCSSFLAQHASEEYQHGRKLFTYVMETGGLARVGAIEAPKADFASVQDIFDATLAHEIAITAKINDLVKTAMNEGDFSTFNFLQWYTSEQHEEEKLFRNIVDRIRVIGPDGKGLYWIDKEIGKMGKKDG